MNESLIGGKAANLRRLAAVPGVTVPPFRVLDASWYDAAGLSNPSAAFIDHLKQELQALRAFPFLAVRSSALGEDSADASFAGQFDTVLNVPSTSFDAVLRAVQQCWASAHSERATSYRQRLGLPPPRMAVVVQAMIPGDVSGVCFTANPVTGDIGEWVVSATWGLGEGLVSGRYTGDLFTLSRLGDFFAEQTAPKPLRLSALPGGGTEEQEVPEALREVACLDARALRLLRQALRSLDATWQCPLDIEFTFHQGNLYLLQVRPIVLAHAADRAGWGEKILWDNSNIVESYSGLTSPLTFSFISLAYQEVYEQFGRMLGVSRRVHEQNQRIMRTYLGLIRGRVFYNLFTWYASLAQLPFFRYTSSAMEAMMGVRQGIEIKRLGDGGGFRPARALALLNSVGRILWHTLRAQATVRAFQKRFAHHYARYDALAWDRLPPQRLMALYEEMTLLLLKRWQAPILADTLAMVFYKALAALCAKWVAPEDPGFQNGLLAGQGEMESTEPARNLVACFDRMRHDPFLMALFRDRDALEIRAVLSTSGEPGAVQFRRWLEDYLERYGSRSMNELKLETPTLREDPSFLFVTLQNYFRAPEAALASMKPVTALRDEANLRVKGALRGHPVRRLLFSWVLKQTARHIRNREAMRFARSRVYGLVRRLVLSYGSALEAAGLLGRRDDVFFLTIPELQAYAEGRAVTLDLKGLVTLRRAEYAEFGKSEPADRFHTVGLPHYRQTHAAEAAVGNVSGDVLRGTCCCAGDRTGKVRVIRSPSDDLRLGGEILVAPRTDPGWIPLYPSISALLIEKGSILSHSAIVAREMGIPTIVGIDNLLNRLNDGDEVEVHAAAGEIRILSSSKDAA